MENWGHVWRLLILIILVAVIAFTVQRLLRPEGYGEVGNYRVGGLYDTMAQDLVHQGKEVCGDCHDDILSVHEKDIHFGVNCEDCHGPGHLHVKYYLGEDDSIIEEAAAMPKEYTLEGCLFCHRELVSRPRDFPQVDPAEHYRFLKVTEPNTRCIECHSPHEPLFLLTKVSEARIHPVIYECSDCHETEPQKDHRQVPDHPVIFVCKDCHPAVVKDFKTHEHAFLRCTACHLFHQETESAGRIFKNGNRRFCLLCHEKKPFKSQEELPQIVSSEHLAEQAADFELDLATIQQDPRACLGCHFDFIHDSELIEEGGRTGL